MSDLSGDENVDERARWSPPARDVPPGARARQRPDHRGRRVLPAAERDRPARSAGAGCVSWAVVAGRDRARYLLLFGIVSRAATRSAARRRRSTRQVGELSDAARPERGAPRPGARGGRAHDDAQRARAAPHQHRPPRRAGPDARAGAAAPRRAARSAPGRPSRRQPPSSPRSRRRSDGRAARHALDRGRPAAARAGADVRTPEVAARAVDDHERRSGTTVELRRSATSPARRRCRSRSRSIRALQELLSNATRHGGGAGVRVRVDGRATSACASRSRDAGPGFDPRRVGAERRASAWPASASRPSCWAAASTSVGARSRDGVRVWWPLRGAPIGPRRRRSA